MGSQLLVLDEPIKASLNTLDIVIIRVDPPFDSEYLYGTHILERAKKQGVQVVNDPQAIRDCNENCLRQSSVI